jgi:hypothetical protein
MQDIFERLPFGWLDIGGAKLIYETAKLTTGPILEVGCYFGRSTVLLAHLGREVYTVDSFVQISDEHPPGEEVEATFRHNIAPYPNVTLFKMPIADWEPRPCGFAYLDGDHSHEGTLEQIDKALACNPDYIALHDMYSPGDRAGVTTACAARFGKCFASSGITAVFESACIATANGDFTE